jgi:hypothetical protein
MIWFFAGSDAWEHDICSQAMKLLSLVGGKCFDLLQFRVWHISDI